MAQCEGSQTWTANFEGQSAGPVPSVTLAEWL